MNQSIKIMHAGKDGAIRTIRVNSNEISQQASSANPVSAVASWSKATCSWSKATC